MILKAYNFLASWQLFPEKGTYESGDRPLSGLYKMEALNQDRELSIHHSWVSLDQQAFAADYRIVADGDIRPFANTELADQAHAVFTDGMHFEIHFHRAGQAVLHIVHEIMPNGYLRITQQGFRPDNSSFTNSEMYHKQLSVLPYAASVSSALIRPTEEGVIRHKALTAMEEQTNMQLDQIRQQVELLALQAREIQKRKELSLMIYNAKLQFKPNIGQTYYLYEKKDESVMLSLVSPKEWGGAGPFKRFVVGVQLLADHTWREV